MGKGSTAKLAYGGIFTAISLIFLFLAGIIPKMEMVLYAVSSLMPALMIIENAAMEKRGSVVPGVLVYVATVLLGVLVLPNKVALLPYVIFFGIYGVVKYYIDRFNNAWVRRAIKGVYFAITFCIAYFALGGLLLGDIDLPDLFFPLVLIGAVACMFLFDYIFSLGIQLYFQRIHPRAFRNIDVPEEPENE